jgi:hypothetical protein
MRGCEINSCCSYILFFIGVRDWSFFNNYLRVIYNLCSGLYIFVSVLIYFVSFYLYIMNCAYIIMILHLHNCFVYSFHELISTTNLNSFFTFIYVYVCNYNYYIYLLHIQTGVHMCLSKIGVQTSVQMFLLRFGRMCSNAVFNIS